MLPASPPQLVEVRLDSLQLSPTNPRKQFDATRHAELTASIQAQGVLVPLLCRPLPSQQLEVVAGARRYHAAKAAGLITVPAIIRTLTDTEALEVQIIENLQRDDIHPLDEAEAYHTLRTTAGYDLATLAAKVGKSRREVAQRLQLTALTPDAHTAFRDDRLSTRHAFLIARLPADDQPVALKACYRRRWSRDGEVEQLISAAEVAEWIEQNLHLDLRRAPFSLTAATLVPDVGPCTTCPKRTGYVPDLFPDIAKQDTCTDRACYERKLAAYLAQCRQAFTHDGLAPLELSTMYDVRDSPEEGGPLPPSCWEEVEPGSCAHSTHGLIVSGQRVGTVLTVCATADCPIHWHVHLDTPSTEADTYRAQHRAQRVELAVREALMVELLARVTVPLPRAVMNHMAILGFERLWLDYQKATLARYKWGKAAQRNLTGVVAAQIPGLSDTALAQFMLTMLLVGELRRSDTAQVKRTVLDELAALYEVDTTAIRKQVTSALEAKAAKRASSKKSRSSHRPKESTTIS